MVRISVVMPARIPKPLGATMQELKEHYSKSGFGVDAKIIESAMRNSCVAFRFNYHKVKYKERRVIYYISIAFDFMEKENADVFFKEYEEIIDWYTIVQKRMPSLGMRLIFYFI